MLNLNTLHARLSPAWRYALAVAIFIAALVLRFLIFPIEAGFPFVTFYLAIVVSLYLCGTWPGALTVALSAVAAYSIFVPPFSTIAYKPVGNFAVGMFLFAAYLIGAVIKQLQSYAEQYRVTSSALRESEQHYRSLLEDLTETICRFKTDGTILYVNDAFCRLFGKSRESLVGQKWHPVAFSEDIPLINDKLALLSPTNPIVTVENRIVTDKGVIRWGQFVNHAFFDDAGHLIETQAVGRDITERKELENKLRQLTREQHAMLDNDLVGIAKVKDRQIIWKNRAMERIFGYESDEVEGMPIRTLYPDDATYQAVGEVAYPILKAHGVFRTQLELVRKDGKKIWVDSSGVQLSEESGELLWILVDITAQKKHEEQISQIAYHDILTGLPNRLLFSDRLEQALAQSERSQRLLAVCYLDLDGFKPINDTFGHDAGDALLKEIARRMQASVRINDTVARLGGDEFVLLLTSLENIEEYEVVVQRIIEAINKPVQIDDTHQANVTASIGITMCPFDSRDPETLLRHADQAMYQAKKLGRNRVYLYGHELSRM